MPICVQKGIFMKKWLANLIISGVCLGLCWILPFVTGQIPQIGQMLCPMHIPVLLCGFLCGWPWGLCIGCIAPLLRSAMFGMPPFFPTAVCMSAELAVYGLLAGFLYRIFPKKAGYVYLSLLLAMLGGRLVWGAARFLCAGLNPAVFPLSAFFAGAVTTYLPGIALQILLIPAVVLALRRAGLPHS